MRLKLSDLPELPAEPHSFLLQPEQTVALSDGRRGTYRRAGQGQPVLLLHGLWTTAYTFRSLIEPLAEHCSLIMPELVDPDGTSGLVQAGCAPADLASLALALCDALEIERPVLVGHAECGLGVLELCLEAPERLAAAIVVGTSIELPFAARLVGRWRGRGGAKAWAKAAFAQPDRAALEMLSYADPAVLSRQEVRQLARGWAMWPSAQARAGLLSETLTAAFRRPTLEKVEAFAATGKNLDLPLALIYGNADRLVPAEHGQRLNRMLPGSELHLADRSSGAAQVEKPAWTADIIARVAASVDAS